MEKYDLLVGNGCSFTEGGGLNNPKIFEFYTKERQVGNNNDIFMQENNWVVYLGNKMKLPYYNLSVSASSNDYVIERAYDFCKDNLGKSILIINQLTIPERLSIVKNKKRITYNGAGKVIDETFYPNLDDDIDVYYKSFISEVFDYESYWKDLSMKIDLFDSWCEEKLIKNYWMSWEPIPIKSDKILDFNTKYDKSDKYIGKVDNIDVNSVRIWSRNQKDKLFLDEVPNIPVKDGHLSIKGHKVITNKLYKTLIKT